MSSVSKEMLVHEGKFSEVETILLQFFIQCSATIYPSQWTNVDVESERNRIKVKRE